MPTEIRLILGDQLNASHSWYRQKQDNVLYLICELHQETQYVKHHVQKLCAFFLSMQNFAEALAKSGHKVVHLTLEETFKYKDLPDLIESICAERGAKKFSYQRPDEYRLLTQLRDLKLDERIDGIDVTECDTEHFYQPFEEINTFFKPKKATRMETFYRKMRVRHDVLMSNGEPEGDRWNFDQDNRNKLKAKDIECIPEPLVFDNPVDEILQRIEKFNVPHFGNLGDSLIWPTTRKQALSLLTFFCDELLPLFGTFQDAMTDQSPHAWTLYHSRLSFALNVKILSPKQVVDRAVESYRARPDEISLSQIEGFVRQILGWREFIRGIYWVNMPEYSQLNKLEARRQLPSYFWTGETKMNCVRQAVSQSLDYAYAHHIQRLMITGNFCLLAGIDPKEVDEWYLGIYIDAIEWVEMPNTRGMCQYADGGIVASKPYTASGAYVNRMSDYCRSCHYDVKLKTGDKACPMNSLYWHFMDRHRDLLGKNPRIGMAYRTFDKMEGTVRDETLNHANRILSDLEKL